MSWKSRFEFSKSSLKNSVFKKEEAPYLEIYQTLLDVREMINRKKKKKILLINAPKTRER